MPCPAYFSRPNYFVRPETVSAFGFDWGKLALTVGPRGQRAQRSRGRPCDGPARGGHARHNHPGAEEIILVIAGTGEQMVEDENGTPITEHVGPGCTIYVPESRFHSTLNTGEGPMTLFVVYSPPGRSSRCANCPTSAYCRPVPDTIGMQGDSA